MDDKNVIDFGSFKNQKDLEFFAQAQYKTILAIKKQLDDLTRENTHLKSLLSSSSPVLRLMKTPEEDICEIELKRLKDKSVNQPLTLEETKKLDLIIKNLILLREISDKKEEPPKPHVPTNELIAIASGTSDVENNDGSAS